MKSLVQVVTLSLVLAAPVASFAQTNVRAASQATQFHAVDQRGRARDDGSGYGAVNRQTAQAGAANETTVSSYSPPIHNVYYVHHARLAR